MRIFDVVIIIYILIFLIRVLFFFSTEEEKYYTFMIVFFEWIILHVFYFMLAYKNEDGKVDSKILNFLDKIFYKQN